MRFTISTFLIAITSLLLQLYFPWWSLAIAAFLVGFFSGQKSLFAFFSGFLGVALVWCGYASLIDFQTHSILSQKIAELFLVNSSILLILITGLIGGLVGGSASLSGNLLKRSIRK